LANPARGCSCRGVVSGKAGSNPPKHSRPARRGFNVSSTPTGDAVTPASTNGRYVMRFGKASVRRVLAAVVVALAIVAGNAVVSAWAGDAGVSASSGPVPVGSPTPTHHGHGPA